MLDDIVDAHRVSASPRLDLWHRSTFGNIVHFRIQRTATFLSPRFFEGATFFTPMFILALGVWSKYRNDRCPERERVGYAAAR